MENVSQSTEGQNQVKEKGCKIRNRQDLHRKGREKMPIIALSET